MKTNTDALIVSCHLPHHLGLPSHKTKKKKYVKLSVLIVSCHSPHHLGLPKHKTKKKVRETFGAYELIIGSIYINVDRTKF